MNKPVQAHVRGLQRIWVPEHSCWVFVWSADNGGNLDKNHAIAYWTGSSPAEFTPLQGQFVLTNKDDGAWICYGVPYHIESINGVVKCYYVDLTPALGWPVDSSSSTGSAKWSKATGICLEGQFSRESISTGQILWNTKDTNVHNNPLPVIEVTDISDVEAIQDTPDDQVVRWNNQYGAPSGAILVQYERDSTGRIITDDDGFPHIAQIDPDPNGPEAFTVKNYKIGYLGLAFQKDFFGDGLHGWVADYGGEELPFEVKKVRNPDFDSDPTQPAFKLGVVSNSHLFNSEDKDTYEEDNSTWGLLGDDPNLDPTMGTFDVGNIGDKIWLQITLDQTDQSITSIDVKNGPVGNPDDPSILWDEYPDPIAINIDDPTAPFHEFYNQIIAEITDPEQDPRQGFTVSNSNHQQVQVTQCLFTDLMMTTGHTTADADQPNLPILVAVPWRTLPGTNIDGSADEINSADPDIMTPWAFGETTEDDTPFKVVPVVDPNNTTDLSLIGVIDNSHLFNSEDKDTHEEDNTNWGLLDGTDITGTAFSVGNIGDKIWLEIQLNQADQSITSIQVKQGPVGGAEWDEYPDPIAINIDDPVNPYQEFYNQIIAEITDPEQDPRAGIQVNKGTNDIPNFVQVTQLLFTDLMMTTGHTTKDADQPDLPILVALPWRTLPGTSVDGAADEINSDPLDLMTPWALGETLEQEFPFQVVNRVNDSNVTEIGVVSNSHLFNSEDKDTYEEDNSTWGLLSDDRTTGWITLPAVGSKIYLQIEVDSNQSIINIDVVVGTAWNRYPDPVFINTSNPAAPYQQFYYQIIAEITDYQQDPRPGDTVNDGAAQITQLLFTNLMMTTAHTTSDADEPDLPLIVALPWNGPGTSVDGAADEVNQPIDGVTPFALGPPLDANNYSFKMTDKSTTNASRVLILDGDVIDFNGDRHMPQGMGNDDYILTVNNDGDEIWLIIPHPPDDLTSVIDPVTIDTGSVTPQDTSTLSYITIGNIFIDNSTDPPTLVPHNTVCGDYEFGPTEADTNRYSFKMVDASDANGVKVSLVDGMVIDQDDVEHEPTGMGNDDLTRSVPYDGAEVYLIIPHDEDYNITGAVTIEIGATPVDTQTIQYTVIGYVNIDSDIPPYATVPHNTLCGDYNFEPPIDQSNAYSFKLIDASFGTTARVRVLDGVVVDEDGNEHTPQGMGDDQLVFQVSEGEYLWLAIDYDQSTRAIIEPITVQVGAFVPDDQPGLENAQIGYVNIDNADPASVIGHNSLCGDYFFNPDMESLYSFQMFDGSVTGPLIDTPMVRITDGMVIDDSGNETEPQGMGQDDFSIQVLDQWEIWLVIPHDSQNIVTGNVTIASGPAGSIPEDTSGTNHFRIGYVNVESDGTVHPHNTQCGDVYMPTPPQSDLYSFEMFDASTPSAGFQVRIIDGEATDVFGNSVLPSGMGNDDYTIGVFDGAEIWLGVVYNPDTNEVLSAFLQIGEPAINPDTSVTELIGYVSIENNQVYPHNSFCGDYFLDPGLAVTDAIGNSVDECNQINFIGGALVEHDPQDVNEFAVDVTIGTTVTDAPGSSVDRAAQINFIGGVIVSNGGTIPDDEGGGEAADVTIGTTVTDDQNNAVDRAAQINFIGPVTVGFGGTLPDDEGGGVAVDVTISGGVAVGGDVGFVDDVQLIQFTISSDPSAGYINVTDGGDGVAIVEIPVLPPDSSGTKVLGSVGGDVQWFPTAACAT